MRQQRWVDAHRELDLDPAGFAKVRRLRRRRQPRPRELRRSRGNAPLRLFEMMHSLGAPCPVGRVEGDLPGNTRAVAGGRRVGHLPVRTLFALRSSGTPPAARPVKSRLNSCACMGAVGNPYQKGRSALLYQKLSCIKSSRVVSWDGRPYVHCRPADLLQALRGAFPVRRSATRDC